MTSEIVLTILGCGSSAGVPRLGGPDLAGDWGKCDPANPKNRRTRCSVLVERRSAAGVTRVLVDSTNGDRSWTTIGVSENIIEASWQALYDSLVYGLLQAERGK